MKKVLKSSLLKGIQQGILPFCFCCMSYLLLVHSQMRRLYNKTYLPYFQEKDGETQPPHQRKHWSPEPNGKGLSPFCKRSGTERMLLSEGQRYSFCRAIYLSWAGICVDSCLICINLHRGFFDE